MNDTSSTPYSNKTFFSAFYAAYSSLKTNNSHLFRKIVLATVLFLCLLDLAAQENENLKVKIEAGVLLTSLNSERLGLFLNVEPKLKTSKYMAIGMRFGIALNEQEIDNFNALQFTRYDNVNDGIIQFINPDNGILSLAPTLDYQFLGKKAEPYLGVGIGYYFLTNYSGVSRRGIADPANNLNQIKVDNQFGFLLRGGFNIWQLIIGLELNYIPNAAVKLANGEIIGQIENSFIGLSLGYAFGPFRK